MYAVLPLKRRKAGQVGQLLHDRELEVVAGDRLVEGERLGLVARPRLRRVGVDVELAGTAAVRRRVAVVGDGRVLLLVRRHDDHLAGSLRKATEPLADRVVRARQRRPRHVLDLLAGR